MAASLFDVETGLGTLLRNVKQDSPVWTCAKVPPGHYVMDLRSAHSGSVRRDALWVDGKLPRDAGRIGRHSIDAHAVAATASIKSNAWQWRIGAQHHRHPSLGKWPIRSTLQRWTSAATASAAAP